MTQSAIELRSIVLQAVAEVAPEADPETIDSARPLRDEIDLDSLDMLRLLGLIEAATGTTFAVTARADRASLDELVQLLEQPRG